MTVPKNYPKVQLMTQTVQRRLVEFSESDIESLLLEWAKQNGFSYRAKVEISYNPVRAEISESVTRNLPS